MEYITYLLGAGASANVLPVVKRNGSKQGIAQELENFLTEIMREIPVLSQLKGRLYDQLHKIIKTCMDFGTPDLAAKHYLEKKDEDNYGMLKLLLSEYFYFVESSPNKTGVGFDGQNLDPRVVPFLTTITNKGKIPKEVRILSWNYDTQIEMGAQKLHPVKGRYNDFNESFHVWPSHANDTDRIDKDYFLLHLNGTARYMYSERHLAVENPSPLDFAKKEEPLLSFAWEDDENYNKPDFTRRRLELATRMIENTTILVVIGYSFPFFNRKIDTELFKAMKKLKKVYFQDPHRDGQFLFSQFNLRKSRIVTIEHIKDPTQYYVPFEL
jgi:hypothetical protein